MTFNACYASRKETLMSTGSISRVLLFAVAILAGTADAGIITWGPATDVATAADVDTSGLLVEARNATANGAVPGSATVNSVLFTNASLLPLSAAVDTWSGTTGDAGYDTLLSTFDYGGGAGVTQISVGGGNLFPGTQYRIQIRFTDDRSPEIDNVMRFGDGFGGGIGANTVDLNDDGQYAIGTFTADAATQTLAMDPQGFGNSSFNAYQIRLIPEPSTFALAALGLLGLIGFGRRRRK